MSLHIQGFRYVLVGVCSNFLLFCIYIILTKFGIGHKVSMTMLYFIGMMQTFILNKYWTFENNDKVLKNIWRYMAAYGFIYLMNLIMLFCFVDILMLNHIMIQGGLIVVLAVLLFLFQKYWVFDVR